MASFTNHSRSKNKTNKRTLRIEELESRDLLSVSPFGNDYDNLNVPENNLYDSAAVCGLPSAVSDSPSAVSSPVVAAAAPIPLAAPAPSGYNTNDWDKVEAAKAANSAVWGRVTVEWTEVGGEQRLTGFDAVSAGLTGVLDLSGCTALTKLECHFNNLTELNVSGCSALESLDCGYSHLDKLDVSGCTALKDLNCHVNNLTELDVSSCSALASLECEDNQLEELNVSGCTALEYLDCSRTPTLKKLDVSGCVALETLYCNDDKLTELNVSGCAALFELNCSNNLLEELDVSGCKALLVLDCYDNQLEELDVSDCAALEELKCYWNLLTELDFSGLSNLKLLNCSQTPTLQKLDVSGCVALAILYCNDNQLTELNVSGCTALDKLHCYGNQLTELNVFGYSALSGLFCHANPLTELNLYGTPLADFVSATQTVPSSGEYRYAYLSGAVLRVDDTVTLLNEAVYNPNDWNKVEALKAANSAVWGGVTVTWTPINGELRLTKIDVANKGLAGVLDLSGCTALTKLECYFNDLTELNVSGCTALTYLNCSETPTLKKLDVSGCVMLNTLYCNDDQLKELNVSGCTALETLWCYDNQLTALDVSGCTALETLRCYDNQLTKLDVSDCSALDTLECNTNQLTTLDVSGLSKLVELNCSETPTLKKLDVSGCVMLTIIYCNDDQLTTLDVSGCTALETLWCYDNQLTALDVSGCTVLETLDCHNNKLTELNVLGCSALKTLECYYNKLTELNLSGTPLAGFASVTPATPQPFLGVDQYDYTLSGAKLIVDDTITLHSTATATEPGNVTSVVVKGTSTADSITITWTAPANPGTTDGTNPATIASYEVKYVTKSDYDANGTKAGFWAAVLTSATVNGTEATASNLQPNTEYVFFVVAKNSAGLSSTGVTFNAKTDSAVVPPPPLPPLPKLITNPQGTNYKATVKGMKAQTKDAETTVSSVALFWTPNATKDVDTAEITIDVHAPKPKGGTAPLVATIVFDAKTGAVISQAGAEITVKLENGKFKIVIKGLDSGTKYTLEMQAKSKNGTLSKMTKATATTVKYAAPKSKGVTDKGIGTATIKWEQLPAAKVKIAGTRAVTGYELGVQVNGAWLFGSDAVAFASANDLTVDGADGNGKFGASVFSAKIKGLASQKYTFGVRELADITPDGGISFAAKSAVVKFSVAPVAYKAPAFDKPAAVAGNSVTLNLKTPSKTAPATGTQVYGYEVGVYNSTTKQYDWGADSKLGNDTDADGKNWTITGVAKGMKIAIREVLYAADNTVIAKSAIKVVTVK